MKSVTAKGRRYDYFDTGVADARGRPIRKRLPARDDPSFGEVYAGLLGGRSRRAAIAHQLTVPKLIDQYEASIEFKRLAANTQTTYSVYLRVIAEKLNTAPAAAVERRDFMALRDKMADRPGAANGMIRTARALYRWARLRDLVEIEPCKGIELFDAEDYAPWSNELLSAGLASEDEPIQLAVTLLYYSAQRIGDVCRMRWSDFRDGFVYVTQEKTGKSLEIPSHSSLSAILARTPRRGLTILCDERGRPRKPDSLRRQLQKFASERGEKVVPHGLRKNAVIAMLEVGCSVAETAAVTGQSLGLVEHYAKRRSNRTLATAAILKMEGGKR